MDSCDLYSLQIPCDTQPIRIKSKQAQKIRFGIFLESFSMVIKSNLQSWMHLISDQKTNPNSLYNTHISKQNLEDAQNTVETARQELKKACKSVRSKSWLEHDLTQDHNATPFPDIQWS